MGACSRCRPACRPAGSRRSRRARWRSGSPASRSCPSRPAPTPPRARSSTGRSSCCSPARAADRTAPRLARRSSQAVGRVPHRSRLHRCSASTPTQIAVFDDECRELVERLLPHGGPDRHPRDRARAAARGTGRRARRCAASSTGSSSTPTASWSSPTTRPGRAPSVQLRAEEPGRRALLLVPVRERVRPAAGGDPADVPERRARRSGHAVGAVGAVHHHPHARPCGRRSSGPAHRRLPAPAEPAVRRRARSSSGARRSAATPSGPPSRPRPPDALLAVRRVTAPRDATPGQGTLGPAVERFDQRADAALERRSRQSGRRRACSPRPATSATSA